MSYSIQRKRPYYCLVGAFSADNFRIADGRYYAAENNLSNPFRYAG